MLCNPGFTTQLAHAQQWFAIYEANNVHTFLGYMQVWYSVKQLGMSPSLVTAQHMPCQSQGLIIGNFCCEGLCSWHAVIHMSHSSQVCSLVADMYIWLHQTRGVQTTVKNACMGQPNPQHAPGDTLLQSLPAMFRTLSAGQWNTHAILGNMSPHARLQALITWLC